VWGDGVGQITMDSSGQQVVSNGIGQMVQTVLRFFGDNAGGNNGCRQPNPTQSGGIDCSNPGLGEASWTGSPVMSETVSGTSPVSFTAVVRPLDFCHNPQFNDPVHGTKLPWSGTSPHDPLVFRGYFTRTDTLGCIMGPLNRKDVLKSSSALSLGEGWSGFSQVNSALMLNTYWLLQAPLGDATQANSLTVTEVNSQGQTLNVPFAYNAMTGKFNFTDPATGQPSSCNPNFCTSGDGHAVAVIVSRADQSFAYSLVMMNLRPGDFVQLSFNAGVGLQFQANRPGLSFSPASATDPLNSYLVLNNFHSTSLRVNEIMSSNGTCQN
jgi:hypothetical protein